MRTPLNILLIAGTAGAVLMLYAIDPADLPFRGPCLLNRLTGAHCPLCGGTRAVHSLLRARIREAFGMNLILMIMLPLFPGLFLFSGGKSARWAPWIILALMILYLILRNIPLELFQFMAPGR